MIIKFENVLYKTHKYSWTISKTDENALAGNCIDGVRFAITFLKYNGSPYSVTPVDPMYSLDPLDASPHISCTHCSRRQCVHRSCRCIFNEVSLSERSGFRCLCDEPWYGHAFKQANLFYLSFSGDTYCHWTPTLPPPTIRNATVSSDTNKITTKRLKISVAFSLLFHLLFFDFHSFVTILFHLFFDFSQYSSRISFIHLEKEKVS